MTQFYFKNDTGSFPEFSSTGFQRNWKHLTKELNILKDCYFVIKTVWSVLSLYSPFYLHDNKYWYDITDMIVCMPGTRKSHFLFLSAIPELLYGTLMILVGLLSSSEYSDTQCILFILLSKRLANSLSLSTSSEISPPALLGSENSLFITFFWIFLLGQLFGRKNKPTKHHKTTNITKQTNKQNKQTRNLGSCWWRTTFKEQQCSKTHC